MDEKVGKLIRKITGRGMNLNKFSWYTHVEYHLECYLKLHDTKCSFLANHTTLFVFIVPMGELDEYPWIIQAWAMSCFITLKASNSN